jgi:curved DNA-binding protein CbpA
MKQKKKKISPKKKFKEINSAYNILIDTYKREIYDKTGKDDNIDEKYQKYQSEEKYNNNYNKRERSRDKEEYMREGFHY